jgi:hypothetical protein
MLAQSCKFGINCCFIGVTHPAACTRARVPLTFGNVDQRKKRPSISPATLAVCPERAVHDPLQIRVPNCMYVTSTFLLRKGCRFVELLGGGLVVKEHVSLSISLPLQQSQYLHLQKRRWHLSRLVVCGVW